MHESSSGLVAAQVEGTESDEHITRTFARVRRVVADAVAQGDTPTMEGLTDHIASEMPPPGRHQIDAFGGSTWTID